MVQIKTYKGLPVCKSEILRYAGCRDNTVPDENVLDECIKTAKESIFCKVCYAVFDVNTSENECDFGVFTVKSSGLAKNLSGCKKAVIFAATLGVGTDRLISKYTSLSPLKALLYDAVGTQQVETLCDTFCRDIEKEYNSGTKPRFSPGYGDFDISYQKNIFSCLNCEKNIGLTLTDSMLMVPSKSVTAVVGLTEIKEEHKNKCDMCENKNCSYRGAL